jgi:hypothetical protein
VKVGLFAHRGEDLPIESLLHALSDNGIEASVYRIRENWHTVSTDELRHNFASLSHIVLWAENHLPPTAWCALLAGYAIGVDCELYVLAPEAVDVEPYLDGFSRARNSDELLEELTRARLVHEQARRTQNAREELIAGGFALTDRTFLEAVGNGHEQAVRDFLILGFSPNLRDESGLPALFHAVRSGSTGLVQLLVDYGADVNEQSGDRGTSPLMEAAGTGQVGITRLLLSAGADPDMVSHYGQTATILAASEGHAGTVKLLLEWNARTDPVDHLGMTALKYAELFRHEEVVAQLREAG